MATSQMQIKVISVEVGNGTTKTGKPYEFIEVFFKNLSFEGKAENKKIMPFGAKDVFNTLKGADAGTVFTVLREKDDAGFWQWVGISEGDGPIETAKQSKESSVASTAKTTATASPKSTFETPEERAKKQIYIVRQSSISAAIDTLKTDKKSPSVEEVISVAQQYEAFVFGTGTLGAAPSKLPQLEEDEDVPM